MLLDLQRRSCGVETTSAAPRESHVLEREADEVVRAYPYGDSVLIGVALVAILSLGALVCLYLALTVDGSIRWKIGGDTPAWAFWWFAFGIGCAIVLLVGRWVWIDALEPRRIAFNSRGIFMPRKGWLSKVEEFVEFKDITACRHGAAVYGQWRRFDFYASGRKFSIKRGLLERRLADAGAFDEICGRVVQRVKMPQPQQ
jgi:hypothetical protein